jgi:ADP-ribosylglycohydrolase
VERRYMRTVYNDQIRGVIYGGAVADALGAPFEYTHRRDSFKVRWTGSDITLGGVGINKRSAGTFTDDTSMTLASIASIGANDGAVNEKDMRQRFMDWWKKGAYTIDGECDDIGNTTRKALMQGKGASDERDNGNGSLMRISFLALTDATDEEIRQVSSVTHANDDCVESCIQWIHILRMLLEGHDFRDAVIASDAYMENAYHTEPMLAFMLDEKREFVVSNGYVRNTLDTVIWLISHHDSYASIVKDAVRLGGDTDTIASIAGSGASIIYGYDAIPKEWICGMRGKDMLDASINLFNTI